MTGLYEGGSTLQTMNRADRLAFSEISQADSE
jgi:hypothetical protein